MPDPARTAMAMSEGTRSFDTSEEHARALDAGCALAPFRSRFRAPAGTIYLDGNSLGLFSRDAGRSLARAVAAWKRLGIRGWLEAEPPWFHLAERLGALAAPLVGAAPDEVVATGTTTLNIHALVGTLYRPAGRRTKILASALEFPTDIYALRSWIRLHGLDPETHLVLLPPAADGLVDESAAIDRMTDEVALALFSSVLYRSGQLLDLPRLAGAARARGVTIGYDCSHSVGAVPHHFDAWDADFAVWCGYKYLNGGPGAPAFIYLNRRHFDREPALAGWFGCVKERQFEMSADFDHARSAGGWQLSSPGILACAALLGSLGVTLEAGIEAIRAESLRKTSYLISLADEFLAAEPCRFRVGTPRPAERRGGHVALEHPEEAWRICQALKRRGVVPDFRPPNVIRLAPVALYNTYHEIWTVVKHLREIVQRREYESCGHAPRVIP